MKSSRLLLVISGILTVVALVLFFSKNSGTIRPAEKDFAISNIQEATRIIIKQDTTEIILSENTDNWKINNMHPAKKEALNLLFNSLPRLEAISPLPRHYQAVAAKKLENTGIQVEVFSDDHLIKAFYIDYDTSEIAGTIILNKKSKIPFLVKLKGYPVRDITRIFSTDLLYWRDNVLLNYNPDEIATVTVMYNSNEHRSFQISYNTGTLPVIIDPVNQSEIRETDIKAANDYLYFFSNIKYYHLKKEMLLKADKQFKFAEIIIVSKTNEKMTVELFRIAPEINIAGNTEFDLNNCFALINNENDPVLVRYFDIDPILSDLNDFIKK